MTHSLQRGAGTQALHLQLAQRLQRDMRNRIIAPGARLESVRACARRHGVNPQTVVAAYDLLQAQGWVESRLRQGFFVRTRPDDAQAEPAPPAASPLPLPTHATALLRATWARQRAGDAPRAMPGAGTLPADWLALAPLARALRQLSREQALDPTAAGDAEPDGDRLLRQMLSRQLAEAEIPAAPDNLLLCNGATQALDLIVRTMTRPGDAVMVEQPGGAMQFAQLQRAGLHLLPVPRGPTGPDLRRVRHWVRSCRPRLMIVVSRLHNPTGRCLGSAGAHQLLELARAHDFLLVEDDVYAPPCEQAAPLLSAMDGLRHSLLIGGFSKWLAPGWRVGYVAAAAARIERLRDAKLLAGLGSPMLTERALALLLQRGGTHRLAAALRERLARARQRAVDLAGAHGCRFETPPRGLFGWIDTGVDTDRLAQRLHDCGYLIAPGRLFDPQGAGSTLMRLNFAHAQDLDFWAAYARAVRALRA